MYGNPLAPVTQTRRIGHCRCIMHPAFSPVHTPPSLPLAPIAMPTPPFFNNGVTFFLEFSCCIFIYRHEAHARWRRAQFLEIARVSGSRSSQNQYFERFVTKFTTISGIP
ncbi:hypothetical protein EVAR_61671_1 [Eumeta japonica]|uniref:Uncharacterized protein n=1 Tax=Eumeta variegata TaxID=151549 RepID=A0A4C1YV45_EUMVA|nr:hypothetical protein EVAR_61671_1 [Eumeta japonica]